MPKKKKRNPQKPKTKDDKTPIVDVYLESIKFQKSIKYKSTILSALQPKRHTMTENKKSPTSKSQEQNQKKQNSNKSENPDQMDTLSKIIEKISPNFTKPMEKMIPEVLRYQFFLRRESDPSDCVLKVCDKYLTNILDPDSGKKTEKAKEVSLIYYTFTK